MTVAGRRLVQAIKELGLSGNAKGIWPVVGSASPDHALTVDEVVPEYPEQISESWGRVGPCGPFKSPTIGCPRPLSAVAGRQLVYWPLSAGNPRHQP
jgi:hypothetical protein